MRPASADAVLWGGDICRSDVWRRAQRRRRWETAKWVALNVLVWGAVLWIGLAQN